MKIKPGVIINGIKTQAIFILYIVCEVYDSFGKEATVTSGLDGVHLPSSLHYKGLALDFRTNNLTPEEAMAIKIKVKKKLGKHYDVVLEATHLHVEYDPKG